MIGYHLTAAKNWEKIKKEGLVPYRIKDHERIFLPYLQPPVIGIWVWQERLDSTSEIMNVAWHCGKKSIDKVVVMSVFYRPEDVWAVYPAGVKSTFTMTHHIDWQGVDFYENATATLLRNPIPAKQLNFLELYDWSKYIKIKGENNEQVGREKKKVAARKTATA